MSQLREGGILVADLRGELTSNLAVLRKTTPTTVEGRFLSTPGHFMWLRPHADNPLRDGDALTATIDHDHAIQRPTQLDPGALDHPDLRFLLQLREPTIQAIWRTTRDSTELLCLHSRDGAWAEVDTTEQDGRHTVTQGGPRHLWDQIEHTTTRWSELGHPSADRFGVTATVERHRFWLDTPDSPAFD